MHDAWSTPYPTLSIDICSLPNPLILGKLHLEQSPHLLQTGVAKAPLGLEAARTGREVPLMYWCITIGHKNMNIEL